MYHRGAAIVTPELEQQWSDEVHYLHSLWRQGPPNSNPNPNLEPQSAINTNLSASNTVSFKKRKNKNKNLTNLNSDLPDNSAWESSISVRKPQAEIGWPDPIPLPEFPNQVSVEEQERFAAIQMQRKSIMACQVFFTRNEDYMEEDDDDEVEAKVKEDEEVEFFVKVFKEDDELRKYYEKNLENGEFSCLACGGIGEKVGKRFKNCVALVQHSLSIAKTKGRRAHRAYGKAICQVLGWNSDNIPGFAKIRGGATILLKGDTQEYNNNDDNSVGEEHDGILSKKVNCSMEVDKGYQIVSPLPPEFEVIPLSTINTSLSPLTPISDVEAVTNPQSEIPVLKPESLAPVLDVGAVSNPQTEIPVSKPESLTPVPDEELKKYAAIQLQGNRSLACQTFFSSNKDLVEDEEIEFFLGLFKDDNNDLKTYYEKNSENGEFCCLVCDGIRKTKVGKRFKNCFALVQHSLTISKANGRSAHRAFGKAICQVLGWNTHGRLLVKSDSGN
ncbi:hypothetical protein ACHQM5_018429 [Ranunculus cassubicifolius]